MNSFWDSISISPFAVVEIELILIIVLIIASTLVIIYRQGLTHEAIDELKEETDNIKEEIKEQGNFTQALKKNTEAIEKIEGTLVKLCHSVDKNQDKVAMIFKQITDSLQRTERKIDSQKS